ncbi:hypothetical protein [Burkholderia sp. Ax-1719]|uniref:hypothetical protein n=1 Tax=Burkholderia sp. Ax-1719 TaxID=2608334 RepID=UPI00142468D4|nr:hypothetical protein [Burkholderia sp. Ax-1719]
MNEIDKLLRKHRVTEVEAITPFLSRPLRHAALNKTEYDAFFRPISSWERKHLLLHL